MNDALGRDTPHGTVAAVGVVIPACDEEESLPGCLAALARAVRHVPAGVATSVVVVADSCTDGTAEVARAAGACVLAVEVRNVGAARAAGFAHLVATAHAGDRLWLATTDADSRVPANWLRAQLDFAAAGWDAVVGTVEVSEWARAGHGPAVARRFARRYRFAEPTHPHVHGANLGVSAAAYADVGGFPPLAVGEDHALVNALVGAGRRVLRTTALPVETSARRTPRAVGGFGSLLMSLAD